MNTKTDKLRLRRMLSGGAALLLVTLLLVGCSQEDDIDADAEQQAVSFTAGIKTTDGAAYTVATKTRTTAGGDNWLTTDKVGIYMLTMGGSLTTSINVLADNVQYNVTNASTGALSPNNGTPIYYPQSGNVDFIAYYPYGSVTNGMYAVTVAGQTDTDAQNALDVLYSNNAMNVTKSKTVPVALTFDHVLSKVTLNVTLGDGLTSLSGSDVTAVSFSGLPRTASLTLQNGTLTAGAAADFPALKAETSPADATFTALIIPQTTGGTGRTVLITVDGSTYEGTIPAADIFVKGQHYTYPVTVKKTGVAFGTVDIEDWKNPNNNYNLGGAEVIDGVIMPESNSYMVEPGSKAILIPVSQANRVLTADGLGAATNGLGGVTATNFTVELVWGDLPVGTDGVIKKMEAKEVDGDGYVCVEPGVVGNAVICVKVSGVIKWNWHIWVTEPVTSATDNVSGLTWMDRNLGAKSNTPFVDGSLNLAQWAKTLGLFYQWGRKDAFPGSNGSIATYGTIQQYYTQAGGTIPTNANLVGSYTTLPNMVQNPLNFATNISSYHGSLNVSGTTNKSWNNNGAKTIYDPCPPGWKVPPCQVDGTNSWGSLTYWGVWANYSRVFNGVNGTAALEHFYPAAGARMSSNGDLVGIGDRSLYWSANAATTNGYCLRFTDNNMSPTATDIRGSGFPVRCIKE